MTFLRAPSRLIRRRMTLRHVTLRRWALIAFCGVLSACATSPDRKSDDAAVVGAIDRAIGSVAGQEQRRQPQPSPSTLVGRSFRTASGVRVDVVGFQGIPGWAEDNHAAAFVSFRESCVRINGLTTARPIGGAVSTLDDWKTVCAEAVRLRPDQARGFFEARFTPVRIAPEQSAKLTSYYYPEMQARRRPDAVFRHPLYRKPADLVSRNGEWGRDVGGGLTPHFDRRAVYAGALNGQGLELVYLADPVQVMDLQIQGSGRLRLADGSVMNVGYAGKSGHAFRSVGQEAIRRGVSQSGSLTDISAFVRQNPAAGFDLLSYNQSYVYFEEKRNLNPQLGPIGALGVQLSDLRSIAVDRDYTPLGAPVWVEGPGPTGAFRQLMIAQDVGSAIKGPQRADIYWGAGEAARRMALQVNSKAGRLTVLLPTPAVARAAAGTS